LRLALLKWKVPSDNYSREPAYRYESSCTVIDPYLSEDDFAGVAAQLSLHAVLFRLRLPGC
jgi:hypothetical protein